jgi:3-phenylpropionate/trans-cinnamate dioxygenase ferredoxin reductase subunit
MAKPIFCIVGAGMAGGRAAKSLRDRGFDGRVILIGTETEPPYERPPLSKSYLNGELARSKLLLQAAPAYSEEAIEWQPGTTASSVDLRRRKLQLVDSEPVAFDRLLLATGSRPRTLNVPGGELGAVVTYRTLADADRLREELDSGPQVVVIGGGFLGSELAVAAVRRGCRVTIVEVGKSILAPLGSLVSGYCTDLHRQAGVELILDDSVDRFLGDQRVERVLLTGGRSLPCDLALICIGAEPNSNLAQTAGLETDPGVVVGEQSQTRDASIFAAGDVASWWSRRWQRHLRVEHYDNAHQQGIFAAGAMLGESTTYDPVPYFWTEQYGATVQQVGVTGGAAEAVLRGDPKVGKFSVFYVEEGLLTGCVAVDRFPDLAAARRLIAARVAVKAELLGDRALDLRQWSQDAVEAAEAAGS